MNTDKTDTARRLRVMKHIRDSGGHAPSTRIHSGTGINFYTTKRILSDLGRIGLAEHKLIKEKAMWCLTNKGKEFLKENK